MHRFILTALATAALASVASAQTFTGTTVGGPTWNRPNANGALPPNALSGFATAVPLNSFNFTVATAGSYSVQSTATGGWDNYTFLYQNSFNAGSPLTNVIIGNDDNVSIGLSGFTATLTPGTQYFLVTTGRLNASLGAFSNAFSGPGGVLSPEPGTFALVGLMLLPAGIALRRRK